MRIYDQRKNAWTWRADSREARRKSVVSRAEWERDRNSQPGVAGACVSRRGAGWECRADGSGSAGAMAGNRVMKDVVMVGGYQEVEVDFVADNPGLTLFHCHQQLHMDYGFMSLIDYT